MAVEYQGRRVQLATTTLVSFKSHGTFTQKTDSPFLTGVNSKEEVICYNITLYGVTGDYQSPAATSTHIHEAAKGEFGPPRLAFPKLVHAR